jgi:hypothetical protein
VQGVWGRIEKPNMIRAVGIAIHLVRNDLTSMGQIKGKRFQETDERVGIYSLPLPVSDTNILQFSSQTERKSRLDVTISSRDKSFKLSLSVPQASDALHKARLRFAVTVRWS